MLVSQVTDVLEGQKTDRFVNWQIPEEYKVSFNFFKCKIFIRYFFSESSGFLGL